MNGLILCVKGAYKHKGICPFETPVQTSWSQIDLEFECRTAF